MALGWAQRTQKAWVETLTLAEIPPASEEQAAAALALVVCNHSSHPNKEQSAHSISQRPPGWEILLQSC